MLLGVLNTIFLHNVWLNVTSWTKSLCHQSGQYNKFCRFIECRHKKVCLYSLHFTTDSQEAGSSQTSSIYRWLSLSLPRLSRITAYLEVKIWYLPKHENQTTGNKILWKRGEQFLLFSKYFQYISNFKSPVTYIFVNVVWRIIFSSILQIS